MRTNCLIFSLIKKVDFCGELGMETLKKLVSVKNMFFGFDQIFWPTNFTFAAENSLKWPNRESWRKERKEMFPGALPTTAILTNFFFKKSFWKKRIKTKERTLIGIKSLVPLITTNVYRATFKISLENKKWSKCQMMRMECFKNCHI